MADSGAGPAVPEPSRPTDAARADATGAPGATDATGAEAREHGHDPEQEHEPALVVERRPPWKTALRVALSLALLAFLLSKIPLHTVLPKNPHFDTLAWFSAGIAIAIAGIVVSAWRWQLALSVFGHRVTLRTLTSHYFAGQFVGNVLPSTIGGDVLRVVRGGRNTGSRPVAFASVVLERLTGFIALPLLSFVGLALTPSLFSDGGGWLALAISCGALLLLVVLVVAVASPRLAGRFADRGDWKRFVGAVHTGIAQVRREPRAGFDLLFAAVVYQLTTVACVYCAVRTIDVPVGITAVLAFAPAVAMAQVLPLSLSGLGVREATLVVLLGSMGVSPGAAIGVGLCWYAITLVASLVGAPSFAVGGRHPGTTQG